MKEAFQCLLGESVIIGGKQIALEMKWTGLIFPANQKFRMFGIIKPPEKVTYKEYNDYRDQLLETGNKYLKENQNRVEWLKRIEKPAILEGTINRTDRIHVPCLAVKPLDYAI